LITASSDGKLPVGFHCVAELPVERFDRVGGVITRRTSGSKAMNGITCCQASRHTRGTIGSSSPHFASNVSSASIAWSGLIAV
jgi:hypothetical protein